MKKLLLATAMLFSIANLFANTSGHTILIGHAYSNNAQIQSKLLKCIEQGVVNLGYGQTAIGYNRECLQKVQKKHPGQVDWKPFLPKVQFHLNR